MVRNEIFPGHAKIDRVPSTELIPHSVQLLPRDIGRRETDIAEYVAPHIRGHLFRPENGDSRQTHELAMHARIKAWHDLFGLMWSQRQCAQRV